MTSSFRTSTSAPTSPRFHDNNNTVIIMASSTRTAMRLLSPRLHCLRHTPPPSPVIMQIRCSSGRYSNPSQRKFSAGPAAQPSFVESVAQSTAETPETHDPTTLKDPRKAYFDKRAYHVQRMQFAAMGLVLSLAGLGLVMYNVDLDELEKSAEQKKKQQQQSSGTYKMDASADANAKFQGKEVHIIGAGEDKRIVAEGQGEQIELVETGTSSVPHFPRTIYLPTTSDSQTIVDASQPGAPENPGNIDNKEEYTLVGLGIRTVMWIQVYVVGLYIRTTDISALQLQLIHHVNPIASTLVPAEKDDLRKKLLDPIQSREIWTQLLQVPGAKTAWRVTPTRNTDFSHLRDGFVTGISKRTAEAKTLAKGAETEYESDSFGQSIADFKGVFKGGKAPKGSILIMLRDVQGAMEVLFHAKPDDGGRNDMEKLGKVRDERISRLIWLGYLGGDRVSSEAARRGVVEGCVGFAGRPVGSVETRVV